MKHLLSSLFGGAMVFDRRDLWVMLALSALVAIVYGVAYPGHFFMDDAHIVKTNNLVYTLDLREIFTTDYWGRGQNTDLFRPLTILSFALNRLLLGNEPWGYLFVNTLLHLGVSLLLYGLLRQFGTTFQTAWVAAAIFVVHPIHAEPVIQLVGRSELLVAVFGLLALLFSSRPGVRSGALTCLCFCAALLSKENGIVLLALIPARDHFFSNGIRALGKERYRLYSVLLFLTVLWFVYRRYVVHPDAGGVMIYSPQYVPLTLADTGERTLAAFKLQGLYLINFVWPFRLQGMYPASTVLPLSGWWSLPGLVTTVLLAGGSWLALTGWRRRNLLALFVIFYALSFSPTSNLFFAAGFTMADRVAYFPSLWAIPFMACGLLTVSAKPRNMGRVLLVSLILVYFLSAGVMRALTLKSPEILWKSDLKLNPGNDLSRLLLASELVGQKRLVEAENEFKRLLEISPNFDQAFASYASLLVQESRFKEAEDLASRALQLEGKEITAAKIPLALAQVGLGRPHEALRTLEVVRPTDRFKSTYWQAHGKAFEALGNYLKALECYKAEASATGERSADVFGRLGRVALRLGFLREAEEAMSRDVQINSESAASWNSLGVLRMQQGKEQEGLRAFARAVELQPTMQEYRGNLEIAKRSRRD